MTLSLDQMLRSVAAAMTRHAPFLAVLAITAIAALPSCGGSGDAVLATPAPSFNLLTPADTTITPLPPAPQSGFRLVYQEFGAKEDKIWRVSPQDPTNREAVATISHREGWSVKPSLSPDSRMLAYVAVPEGALDASYQGELFMMDLKRQETELVYRGIDLRFRPLWTPDGEYVYARRLFGQETIIVQAKVTRKLAPGDTPSPSPTMSPTPTATPFVEATPFIEETPFVEETPLPEGETPFVEETPFFEETPFVEETPSPSPTPTPAPEQPVKEVLKAHQGTVLTFVPVGFADDGKAMYLVQVQGGTGGGTLVVAYAPATALAIAEERAKPTPQPQPNAPPPAPTPQPQAGLVVKLSDQIARDYDLSPDKKRLTYLAQDISEGQFVLRAFTADLIAKTTAPVPTNGLPPTDHFRPLWHPDGSRVAVGLLPAGVETGAVALVPVGGGAPSFLPAPERGFDVPVAWAPDGSFLAVTSYSGDSLANVGTPRTDLVSPTGHRVVVADGPQYEVVGWFAPPPPPTPTPSLTRVI